MRDGTWWILYRAAASPAREDVVNALAAIEGAAVTEEGDDIAVALDGQSFTVALDDAPGVRDEATKMANEFAAKHRDRLMITQCDHRFVIRYQLAVGRAAANALSSIEATLSALVEEGGAKTYAYNPATCEFF